MKLYVLQRSVDSTIAISVSPKVMKNTPRPKKKISYLYI